MMLMLFASELRPGDVMENEAALVISTVAHITRFGNEDVPCRQLVILGFDGHLSMPLLFDNFKLLAWRNEP